MPDLPNRLAGGRGARVSDLSGVLDDDGVTRLCIVRLSEALHDLLGAQPCAERLHGLADLLDDLAVVCRRRAEELERP